MRRESHNELFPNEGWRLLLPDITPTSVVALGDGPTATTARRLWSGSGSWPPDGGPVDLVVADSCDDATVGQVTELFGPETVAYLEFDWPRRRRPDDLRRKLGRAGLSVVTLYSISPGRHRWSPTWWIPVGCPRAARFVARQITPSRPRSARFVDRLRGRLLNHWERNPGLLVRYPWLLHPSRAQRLGAVIAAPDRSDPYRGDVTIMKIGGSSTDQPVLFTFRAASAPDPEPRAGRSGEPDFVIKVPVIDEEIESSRQEADTLAVLTELDPPVSSIPKPIAAHRYRAAGLWAFGQTYAHGRPLALELSPENMADHAVAVDRWLVELAEKTARPVDPEVAMSALDSRVAELGHSLSALPDGSDLRRVLAASVRDIERSVGVCQHNDLGPWNIHVTPSGDISVIDWADATLDGIPACDYLHFLIHLSLCAHDAYLPDKQARLIAELADPTTRFGALIWQLSADHVTRVGLSAELIPQLRVLTWALDLLRRPPVERVRGLYLELLRIETRRITSRS